MFTTEEREVLKELVLIEMSEIKNIMMDSDEQDKFELTKHLLLLRDILNKLN